MSRKEQTEPPIVDSPLSVAPVVLEVDCVRLRDLMMRHLDLVVSFRPGSRLYRLLQAWPDTPERVSRTQLQQSGFQWLNAAARQGCLPALDYLVALYEPHGDRAMQMQLRRCLRLRASLRGTPEDYVTLAEHLMHAPGLRRYYREAVSCLSAAAETGHPQAHLLLARLYRQGLVTARSKEKYLYHLEEAARGDLAEAQIALAEAYAGEGLFSKSHLVELWLSRAAAHNSPEALYALGVYWFHQDHDRHTARVLRLWSQAASMGHPNACYRVGHWLLSEGGGGEQAAAAVQYLCRASQAGILKARHLLYQHHYDESGRYTGALCETPHEYISEQKLF